MILVDCEATGGEKHADITELALIVVEHGQVTHHWQSLIKPNTSISPYVERLTGITNDMVASAPSFAQQVSVLQPYFANAVLVAHNARVDLRLLKRAFHQAQLPFKGKSLCSHQLAKQFFPDQDALGIKALIKQLDLPVAEHHRAMVDTEVILHLLAHITANHPSATIKKTCKGLIKPYNFPLPAPE